ncbi:MAG TPA: 5-guanidino-2-oxopentanoate decarboxylase [Steroidobacteraceae bacterium]|nr:5-guanidino-2-oxopentanoate decarboxylase [Steroidobacteraceae bacterium]
MSITVGRYLVETLAANDIDTAFGIPGVHTLELYRGLAHSKMRHFLVRHEQGAGFAADGHARASGRPAAALVISGPGVTNVLTAAAQAYSDSVPMLVVASTPPRASLGKAWGVLHELRDQHALAERVFGVARSARAAADVRDHLRACLASLRGGRLRPAYLEVPLDLLGETTDMAPERFADPPGIPAGEPDRIEEAARLLNAAERPLIIAGGGAVRAAAELRLVAERLDALVVTTAAGKGLLPDRHESHLGASLPYRETQELAASADVVLALGTELAETDLYWSMRLDLSGRLIRVDLDPAKLADHYAADLPIQGDARATLAAMLPALEPRAGWRTRIGGAATVRAHIEASWNPAARAHSAALAAIRAALPADGIVLSDMTQIAYHGNYAFPVDRPGCWFHPSGYGTLGFALPAALGAKIAQPARAVLALVGDFGLQFTLAELMTAAEAGLALPIVVWNNAALGQIRDDMIAASIPPLGVVARNPDFQALARACGVRALRVRGDEGLTAAVREALLAAGPTLIEMAEGSKNA